MSTWSEALRIRLAGLCTMDTDALGWYSGAAGGAWSSPAGTTGLALYFPFQLPAATVATQMWWHNGSSVAGNIDAGIYDAEGTRLVSTGAVAQSGASAVQLADITDTALIPGAYYFALSTSSTGQIYALSLNRGVSRLAGILQQTASAHPLPATATFAVPSADRPIFMMGFTGTTV